MRRVCMDRALFGRVVFTAKASSIHDATVQYFITSFSVWLLGMLLRFGVIGLSFS